MFVDTAQIIVKAGDGGNGALSFRHEKYIDRGGPDGGDGGRGGNVIFVADANLNTLVSFRYKQEMTAAAGEAGSKRQRHGRNGANLVVKVPVGTIVFEDGEPIADLTTSGQEMLIAKGGSGGFGNAHFTSSVRQAPRVAEKGEKTIPRELLLELKLLADVGLVGLPNAGKSTLLSVISNATPEIGDYPFTTLTPNLGVAVIDDTSLLIADIPGLIEGAAEGKGLGDAFLKHVERTAVLLHLIDGYSNDIAADYKTITAELAAYSAELAARPQVIAITKIEGLDAELIGMQTTALREVAPASAQIFAISAVAHRGTTELLRTLRAMVEVARGQAIAVAEPDESVVIELSESEKDEAWTISKKDNAFIITGRKIEGFASRTNFDNPAGVQRLRDIMRKLGILHHLQRSGIQSGDRIVIGSEGHYRFIYE